MKLRVLWAVLLAALLCASASDAMAQPKLAPQTIETLPDANALTGAEYLPLSQNQGGGVYAPRRETVANLLGYISTTSLALKSLSLQNGVPTSVDLFSSPPTNGLWLGSGPVFGNCPVVLTGGCSMNGLQSYSSVYTKFTASLGPLQAEYGFTIDSNLNSGFVADWKPSHTYATGDRYNTWNGSGNIYQVQSGPCTSAASGTGPTGTGSQTDGTCPVAYQNSNYVSSKVSFFVDMITGSQASYNTWNVAFDSIFGAGDLGHFKVNFEPDASNNAGDPTVSGFNYVDIFASGNRGAYPLTAYLNIFAPPSGSSFAAESMVLLSGSRMAVIANINDTTTLSAVGYNTSTGGSFSLANVALQAASPYAMILNGPATGGGFSSAALEIIGHYNTGLFITGTPSAWQIQGIGFSVDTIGNIAANSFNVGGSTGMTSYANGAINTWVAQGLSGGIDGQIGIYPAAVHTTATSGWTTSSTSFPVASCTGVTSAEYAFDNTTQVNIGPVAGCSGLVATLNGAALNAGSNGDSVTFIGGAYVMAAMSALPLNQQRINFGFSPTAAHYVIAQSVTGANASEQIFDINTGFGHVALSIVPSGAGGVSPYPRVPNTTGLWSQQTTTTNPDIELISLNVTNSVVIGNPGGTTPVSIPGALTANAIETISLSGSGSSTGLDILEPSLGTSPNTLALHIGVADSTDNAGAIIYSNLGSANAGNYVSFGLYNTPGVSTFEMFGDGHAQLTGSSSTSTIPLLYVGSGSSDTNIDPIFLAGGRAMLGYDNANAAMAFSGGTTKGFEFYCGGTNATFLSGTKCLAISSAGAASFAGSVLSTSPTGGIGYATGSGGAVTQITSRTTGVTLNTATGAITLVSAAGLATYQSVTVTNSAVSATDTIHVVQKSGADKYIILVTAVSAGSFVLTYATTGGTTTEQPVFNFTVEKGVTS